MSTVRDRLVTYAMLGMAHQEMMRQTQICPECRGKGFTTIEVRETATVWAPEYPVTYPVTCYKTRRCWMCEGEGKVRRDR